MDEQFVDEGFTVAGFYAKSMGDAITTFGSVEIIPCLMCHTKRWSA